ncbi:MAG: PRC-barrel domain-containing protein [Geminicoccaceae bacterium]
MHRIAVAAGILAASSMLAASPTPVLSQAVEVVIVDIKSVAKGYRISKLTARDVVNDQSQEIGKIDDFIVDKDKVMFAILEVGGFLGVGGHLVAVPFTSLQLDDMGRKIVLPGATKDQLEMLPVFKYAA